MTEQSKKRRRFSENAESSASKIFSVPVLNLTSPVGVATMAQAAPGPVAARTPSLASPSPVFKRKQSLAAPSPAVSAMSKAAAAVKPTAATAVAVSNPVPATATALAAPNPGDTSKPASATPSPVAVAAVTNPVPATASALAAPNPGGTSKPASATPSPVAVAAVTNPVPATASALAAPNPGGTSKPASATPSPVATTAPNTVATRTPALLAPSPVATAKPTTTVKQEPEDGGVLEGDEQAVVVPAAEEGVILEVKKKYLHCPTCHAPLKPRVFMCDGGHAVCSDCAGGGGANKHCGTCNRAATYTYVPCMDALLGGGAKVPCPYRNFGCARCTAYHAAADHEARCAHAPCYCSECQFEGSPASLRRHLSDQSGRHRWPVETIKYQVRHRFVVPASEHRCLLAAEEDGRVFLLAVGAGRGASGVRPVNIVCVRGNAGGADTRPLYTGVLWVDGPPAAAGHLSGGFKQRGDVANCGRPGEVDMEHGQLHAHVNPEMLHGESKEVHLGICITKFW